MNEAARRLDEKARIKSLEQTRDTWKELGERRKDEFFSEHARELDIEIERLKEAQEKLRQGQR